MSVEVLQSPIDGTRYMLGGEYTKEGVSSALQLEHEKKQRDLKAHDDWLIGAKSQKFVHHNDAAIVETAKRHLAAAVQLQLPIPDNTSNLVSRWTSWSDSIREKIAGLETCQQVLHFAQSEIPFDHRTQVKEITDELGIYEKLVMEEFPYRFEEIRACSENVLSLPETLYLAYGRLVSNIFYWHLRTMMICQENIKSLKRIVEIGGGYGSLARLWLSTKNELERYVIVDLPESLFFSEVALRTEFGDQVGYWEGKDPGTKVVLLPVNRLNEYQASSDLVISVGSLQEMSDAWVSFYMNWLDQHKTKFFYSLNYMGSNIGYLFECRNFWSPRPSNKWVTRLLNPDVPLVKWMCSGRSFVEIFYEKTQTNFPVKFSNWSVLNNNFFNRATYLEGLELLRQDLSLDNAMKFLSIMARADADHKFPFPKEGLSIASLALLHRPNDPWLKKLVDYHANSIKVASY